MPSPHQKLTAFDDDNDVFFSTKVVGHVKNMLQQEVEINVLNFNFLFFGLGNYFWILLVCKINCAP